MGVEEGGTWVAMMDWMMTIGLWAVEVVRRMSMNVLAGDGDHDKRSTIGRIDSTGCVEIVVPVAPWGNENA